MVTMMTSRLDFGDLAGNGIYIYYEILLRQWVQKVRLTVVKCGIESWIQQVHKLSKSLALYSSLCHMNISRNL